VQCCSGGRPGYGGGGAARGRQPWVAEKLGGGGASMGGSDEWGKVTEMVAQPHWQLFYYFAEIGRNFVYWYCYFCEFIGEFFCLHCDV
jgi:hypothetical protein